MRNVRSSFAISLSFSYRRFSNIRFWPEFKWGLAAPPQPSEDASSAPRTLKHCVRSINDASVLDKTQ